MPKNELAISEDRYNSLLEDCGAIITEHTFQSRWVLIEGYHALGKRIREEQDFAGEKTTLLVRRIADDLKISERNIYYAVKFFDTFPDIQKLPDGKSISWRKVKTELLTEGDPSRKPALELPVLIQNKIRTIVLETEDREEVIEKICQLFHKVGKQNGWKTEEETA